MSVVLLPVRDQRLNPVREFYALAGISAERQRLVELFCEDVVLLPSPWLTVGPYRPYFGHAGLAEWGAHVRRHWRSVRLVADEFEPLDAHVLVLGTIVVDGADQEAGWIWTLRDGRIRAMRSFRYREEARRFAEPLRVAEELEPPPVAPLRPRLA